MAKKDYDSYTVVDNGKWSRIDDTDHGGKHDKPHAHDMDKNYGKHGENSPPRPLTTNEKYAYDSFKNEK